MDRKNAKKNEYFIDIYRNGIFEGSPNFFLIIPSGVTRNSQWVCCMCEGVTGVRVPSRWGSRGKSPKASSSHLPQMGNSNSHPSPVTTPLVIPMQDFKQRDTYCK